MVIPLNAATSEKRLTSATGVVLPQSKRVNEISAGACADADAAMIQPASAAAPKNSLRFMCAPFPKCPCEQRQQIWITIAPPHLTCGGSYYLAFEGTRNSESTGRSILFTPSPNAPRVP